MTVKILVVSNFCGRSVLGIGAPIPSVPAPTYLPAAGFTLEFLGSLGSVNRPLKASINHANQI